MDSEFDISFASKDLKDLTIPYDIQVNPQTGEANVSIDIPRTSGRSDFNPNLSLKYNSSGPNSFFGIGWSLAGVSAIGISSKKGLPLYDDNDTYQFNGDDLLPWLEETTDGWKPREFESNDGQYWIQLYRSKLDQQYIRIEKWTQKDSRRIHWRSRDKNNTVSIFGNNIDNTSRIFDPENQERTFSWIIEEQYDKFGNAIKYEYVAENKENIDQSKLYEINRIVNADHFAQRYLKRIHYGNTHPLTPDSVTTPDNKWLFEIVLDYGDHEDSTYPLYEVSPSSWPSRLDSFSTYRSGFEIRTYRLCRKILMFHHFEELGNSPTLIGALTLEHKEDSVASTLEAIKYEGYRRELDTDVYSKKTLPALSFNYSSPEIEQTFRAAPREASENVPYGLGNINYRWIDLYGEGLPGILFEENQAWYYKSNLGEGKLGAQQLVLEKPSIEIGEFSFSDFDSDGNLNLVVLNGRDSGYYEYDRDGEVWRSFQSFPQSPSIDPIGTNARLIDLNGDGRSDIVNVKEDRITWYPSIGKDGFASSKEFIKPRSNGVSRTPTVGDYPSLDYFFVDMTGDGLADQVQVSNGKFEYWPNMGHGNFGHGIVMDNAPVYDFGSEFDSNRIRFVDLDGSGTSDIIYIGRGEIRYWYNANGNHFIEGGVLKGLPYIDNLSSLTITDFLGNGTPCLVWSTTLPGRTEEPLQYLQLTSGIKPRLLISIENSMGMDISLTYSNSASHYLRDKRNGSEWTSKLPQHVTVVDSIETIDHIGNTNTFSRYEYHDGYYDSKEREFRGFTHVDQYDSDIYRGTSSVAESHYNDPVCIRTWFHNGEIGWNRLRALKYYKNDVYSDQLGEFHINETTELLPEEFCLGIRSLAGQIIRTESYPVAKDGSRREHPLEVTQNKYLIRRNQPSYKHYGPGFSSLAAEVLNIIYEESPTDPRITHSFNLVLDTYGIPTKQVTIAYPRTAPDALEEQQKYHIKYDLIDIVNFDSDDRYELALETESKRFELSDSDHPPERVLYTQQKISDLIDSISSLSIKFYEDFSTGKQSRLYQWNKNFYWNDTQSDALSLRQVGNKSLIHHRESACFNNEFLIDVLGEHNDPDYPIEGYYRYHEDFWWISNSPINYHGSSEFYLPSSSEDADNGRVELTYDRYNLVLTEITSVLYKEGGSPVQSKTSSQIDYHLLAPYIITDPNKNVQQVSYDPLGIVILSTIYGDILSESGTLQRLGQGRLEDHVSPTLVNFSNIIDSPLDYLQECISFFYYELDSWTIAGTPSRSITLTREGWAHDGEGNYQMFSDYQVNIDYMDGYGRTIQSKKLVQPGPDTIQYESGDIVVDSEGNPVFLTSTIPRWWVSGKKVFNNKQIVVREFEPYFSLNVDFENDEVLQSFGQSYIGEYDALGRESRVLFPDGSIKQTIVGPWDVRSYDPNDSVAGSPYQTRVESEYTSGSPERVALQKSLLHADTPVISHLDGLGRVFSIEEQNEDGHVRRRKFDFDDLGNPKVLTDANELEAFTYHRDMVGRVLKEESIDSGIKMQFLDSLDREIHIWNEKGLHQYIEYDSWGRIISNHVDGALDMNHLTEVYIYGEDPTVVGASDRNLLGNLVELYDGAGKISYDSYDLLGNVLQKTRRLVDDYENIPDWTDPSSIIWSSDPPYISKIKYDALGRSIIEECPDNTTRKISYHPSGNLSKILISTNDGSIIDKPIVETSTYNARGQIKELHLGNGVIQNHDYNEYDFRLKNMRSFRPAGTPSSSRYYQDIHYTYDPVGNIIHLADTANPNGTPLFNQPRINNYKYDAFYQLIEENGRTHEALQRTDYAHAPDAPGFIKGTHHISPSNMNLVQPYTRTYSYDLNGNMTSVVHNSGRRPSEIFRWRRELWVSGTSNRSIERYDLNGVEERDQELRFDESGNLNYFPHLRSVNWNYLNQLSKAVIIERPGGRDDAEYYVYGADRQRVRKVTQRLNNGNIEITEKIYLDGCEIKRVRRGSTLLLERYSSKINKGAACYAVLHQWTADTLGRETDILSQKRIHYQLNDHLGSSSYELNDHGDIINYEEYFAYGGTSFIFSNDLRDIALKDYRYSGKEQDDATRLYYYGFRYYIPWLCRWSNPDPIGPEDGLNLYQFVHNNPINEIDQNGLNGSNHLIFVNGDVPVGFAERSMTLGGGITGIYLNHEDARNVGTPGLHTFEHRSGGVYYEVSTTIVDDRARFHITEVEIGFGATAVVDAPSRRSRPREPVFNLDDFVTPLSDLDFNLMINDLSSQMTDQEYQEFIGGLASTETQADDNTINYSEPQTGEINTSMADSDRLSFDPFDLSQPQMTPFSPITEEPEPQVQRRRGSAVSEVRDAIIDLGGNNPVERSRMGVLAGAYTVIGEPVGWVIDMVTVIGHSFYDPTEYNPHSERYASDLATYIVYEMGEGDRSATDVSGEVLTNMAIDLPTFGVRHIPDQVSTMLDPDIDPGYRGVAAFNLGFTLYGARAGMRSYANMGQSGLTRLGITTGTQRLNAAATGTPLPRPIWEYPATSRLIIAEQVTPWTAPSNSGVINPAVFGGPEGLPPASATIPDTPGLVVDADYVTRAAIIRRLRAVGTPEAYATEALITRGEIKLTLGPDPHGRPFVEGTIRGTSEIIVDDILTHTVDRGAAVAAHETRHILQDLSNPSVRYGLLHEFEAFQWARQAGDPRLTVPVPGTGTRRPMTDVELFEWVIAHPRYKGLRW